MTQFNFYSFVSQTFWILLFLAFFYFFALFFYLSMYSEAFKLRNNPFSFFSVLKNVKSFLVSLFSISVIVFGIVVNAQLLFFFFFNLMPVFVMSKVSYPFLIHTLYSFFSLIFIYILEILIIFMLYLIKTDTAVLSKAVPSS